MRTVDARAGDVANVLDFGGYGNTIRHNYGNSVGLERDLLHGWICLRHAGPLTIPTAYNAAKILIPGCGNPGAANSANPGAGVASFTYSSPGTGGYVPRSTLTCSGGTSTIACQTMVYSTTIVGTPTIVSAGSGCTNGTETLTGATGVAGTNAVTFGTISVTTSGGAVTAVNSVLTGGAYYQNPVTMAGITFTGGISNGSGSAGTILNVTAMPLGNIIQQLPLAVGSVISGSGVTTTTITALGTGKGGVGTYTVDVSQLVVAASSMTTNGEPMTGAGCVGVTLGLTMGAVTGTVTVAGNYTAVPSNPVGFTSGTGSGAQASFGSGPYWYGNPLVGTISSVVNSGGNSTFNVSSNAQSTVGAGGGDYLPVAQ